MSAPESSRLPSSQRIPIVNVSSSHSGKIHVREQYGVFQRIRKYSNTLLIAVFFLLPFITYQGRQAILLDVTQQQFFFFNITLWPQDFTILAWMFMAAAFGLFFVTVYWGRVWCGFLCPQTAWTAMFMWIEAKVEGNHHHRAALDKAPLSASKIRKRMTKHSLWAIVALVTGCGFMGYFMPAKDLYIDIFTFSSGFWTGVWVWFFALCTYINAGWMREMMCLHCCPYSRFQAVMFDSNTKTVSYDAARGESRGPRKRSQNTDLGDCVDCNLCVDACNQTMEKFGYQPNLISFTSENALKPTPAILAPQSQIAQSHKDQQPGIPAKKLSLKALGYASALLIMCVLMVVDLVNRSLIQLNVIRDRQTLYREVGEFVENSYQLKIRNKTQHPVNYIIGIDSRHQGCDLTLITDNKVHIQPGEQIEYPVTLRCKQSENTSAMSKQTISFYIADQATPSNKVSQDSNFFWPSN
jgi:polyferredoxin